MSEILFALSTWLHALPTVVFIGHFLLLSLIYLPAMKNKPDTAIGEILGEFSKRSLVWMYVALFIFVITGVYLTVIDPNYLASEISATFGAS